MAEPTEDRTGAESTERKPTGADAARALLALKGLTPAEPPKPKTAADVVQDSVAKHVDADLMDNNKVADALDRAHQVLAQSPIIAMDASLREMYEMCQQLFIENEQLRARLHASVNLIVKQGLESGLGSVGMRGSRARISKGFS